MSSAWFGFLALSGVVHLLLVAIPVVDTLKSPISPFSKLAWCLFLVLLPFIGVLVFHFRYRSGLLHGPAYERSAAEERASAGTLAPGDDD